MRYPASMASSVHPAVSEQPQAQLTALLRSALEKIAPDAAHAPIALERPKQESHGDYATNIALQLARTLKRKPRDIAEAIVAALPGHRCRTRYRCRRRVYQFLFAQRC
jgi:arginyl-tRNA synthetase